VGGGGGGLGGGGGGWGGGGGGGSDKLIRLGNEKKCVSGWGWGHGMPAPGSGATAFELTTTERKDGQERVVGTGGRPPRCGNILNCRTTVATLG